MVDSRTRDPADTVATTGGAPPASAEAPRAVRFKPAVAGLHLASLATLLVLLVLTAGLVVVTVAVHDSNEDRLLRQRTREAATTVTAAISGLQAPLASAAEVAQATNGDQARFSQAMAGVVGTGRSFVSAALWRLNGPDSSRPVAVVGLRPELEARPPQALQAVFARASRTPQLSVVNLLDEPLRRVAYVFATKTAPTYAVSAEVSVPRNRAARIRKDQAFSGLGYAIYLGRSERTEALLAASTRQLPLRGRRSGITIPFGDNHLRLVFTPTEELGGSLLARLPWIMLGGGLILAALATLTAERLVRRRLQALDLADENVRLYAAQRSVAETLQHSLLPQTLPEFPGLALGVRYLPGVAGVEIGGDWYDVIPQDDRVLIIVGDVSGRGLPAGIVMASLRYAIRAYAAEGDDPATILTKLGALVNVGQDGCFATVLCGSIDVARHQMTLANAGHLQPLLLDGTDATFVETPVGVPVGVELVRPYESITIPAPARATLLSFTDGLVERRNESLEVGLQRLRGSARRADGSLEELLTDIVRDLADPAAHDDTALLGVRWTA